jgi:SAM-dependent methyltransferase
MENIYRSGEYLQHNPSWHQEDSPWKARQVQHMISRNKLEFKTVAEIGCGAGGVLQAMSQLYPAPEVMFYGFDISPQAIDMARKHKDERIMFAVQDILQDDAKAEFDLLLAMDVLEHVPDYLGFIERLRDKAHYKLFNIPLDLNVLSVLRNGMIKDRQEYGHLHYFSAETALATLKGAGHQVVDFFYANGAGELIRQNPKMRRLLLHLPRTFISLFSIPLASRLFGGYTLVVLTK